MAAGRRGEGADNLRHNSHMLLTRCIRCGGAHRDSLLIHFFPASNATPSALPSLIKALARSPARASLSYLCFGFAHVDLWTLTVCPRSVSPPCLCFPAQNPDNQTAPASRGTQTSNHRPMVGGCANTNSHMHARTHARTRNSHTPRQSVQILSN